MEIQNKIGERVFDKLRSKFRQITLGDAEGEATQNPTDAVFFNFNYVDKQGHDHGNITVSLIDRTMKIYYSKNISTDLEGSELTEWYKFLQDMRKTAMSNLYRFDTHDISKSNLDIADIQATVKRQEMQENKMYGTTKSSYQDQGPAKIIVRHNQKIDPEVRGARSRKVESIFVETDEGERFKMPFNSLPGARAMARHVGNGGRPHDEIGESIANLVNEINTLRPFVARNRNAIYEDESTMEMVEAAKEYYNEARKTLGKIKGKRGYKTYTEDFQALECGEFDDDTAADMKNRFTKKRFSDKMEAAMPVVHKAYSMKKMKPNKPTTPKKPLDEFEEWAESSSQIQTPITEDCASILSDEEIDIVKRWINNQIEELPADLEEKIFWHYVDSGDMPYGTAKARTGDPTQWLFDRLTDEYGRLGEAGDDRFRPFIYTKDDDDFKMTSLKGAPKKIGGHLDDVRMTSLKGAPKKIGGHPDDARMTPLRGATEDDEDGRLGEAEEELCSTKCCGKPISKCHCGPECPHCDCYEKNKKNKKQEVKEGTWATPDTPEKIERLRELLSKPLPFGPNGENASTALYNLMGDDGLFDEIYAWSKRMDAERPANDVIIDWMKDNAPEFYAELGLTVDESTELNEDDDLTDSITSLLMKRLATRFPHVLAQYGPKEVHDIVRDEVSWLTDDWPEDQGFGSSDSYGAWKSILRQFDLEESLDEDVVLPKATYSDYLEVYKSNAVSGTDEDDDAKRMVTALKKKGKQADEKAAKGALKRMAEQKAKEGLHLSESINELKRAAGIIK